MNNQYRMPEGYEDGDMDDEDQMGEMPGGYGYDYNALDDYESRRMAGDYAMNPSI